MIDTLQVRVETEQGVTIPDRIGKRMQASVYTIGDNVLVGHPVEEIVAKKESYENLIQEVFDRILVGYSVKSVAITPKTAANIVVVVSPWSDVIREVKVDVAVNEVSPEVKSLILTDIAEIESVVHNVLIGLPVDAVEWARSVVKIALTEYLSVRLPEYDFSFDITADHVTSLHLILYPKGTIVHDVNLSLRSETIPNLLLLNFRPYIQRQSDQLIGLPVSFVKRHQDYFVNALTKVLNADKNLQKFGVVTNIKMQTANNTDIIIRAETDRYRIAFEGYLDVGREEDNTSLKLHAGKMISRQNEIFAEVDFLPHKVKWILLPGLAHDITPQTQLGFKYDMDQKASILWAKQKVANKWILRFEHTPKTQLNEFAIRYNLHDFVGVEYVINDDDHWLRMIGYF